MATLGVKTTKKIAIKFLEGLYPEYEIDSIDVYPKDDGYDIETEMKERFNPTKRYHANIWVYVSIVEP